MFDELYRKRLQQDLGSWRAEGWVSEDGAARILASLGAPRLAFGLSGLVAVLGALLLGVGVVGLVAANWEAVPRLARLAVLVAALGLAYGAAGLLHRRGHPLFAEAALIVAGLVFAGSIALVGQTYHLAGEFDDAVLMWTLSCLAVALLAGSGAMTSLAVAGAAYWIASLTGNPGDAATWPGLALALSCLAVAGWNGTRFARLGSLLLVGWWTVFRVAGARDAHLWDPAAQMAVLAALALVVWGMGAAARTDGRADARLRDLGLDTMRLAFPALLLALGFLQVGLKLEGSDTAARSATWLPVAAAALLAALAAAALAWRRGALGLTDLAAVAAAGLGAVLLAVIDRDDFVVRLLAGVLVLGACVWCLALGIAGRQPNARALGLAAFGAELIYVYLRTFGTVLDTALALLAGGALFLGAAFALLKIDRRLNARVATGAGA